MTSTHISYTTAFTTNIVALINSNKTVLPSAKTVTSLKPLAPSSIMPHSLSSFWLEATITAAYLINRLPTKTLNMTSPYHKLYHQPPSYLHLKIFGCLCYPWTAYSRAHKLDPKSSPCIFIGYSSDHKGFRCFDPATSKLIISRHVCFHELEFPMAKPTCTPPTPQISTTRNHLSPLFTPTFYPPTTTSTPSPNRPSTSTPKPPPPRQIDTHIQYQRHRQPPTISHTPPLPPILPLPKPLPITS